ncbi:MAG: hypothetical protein QOF90_1226, partial [Acetobacteraceae bacterium]|nr:hypothetical protein [Acetobacteraceae bacterium]
MYVAAHVVIKHLRIDSTRGGIRMIHGGLFARFILEDGIRETDAY